MITGSIASHQEGWEKYRLLSQGPLVRCRFDLNGEKQRAFLWEEAMYYLSPKPQGTYEGCIKIGRPVVRYESGKDPVTRLFMKNKRAKSAPFLLDEAMVLQKLAGTPGVIQLETHFEYCNKKGELRVCLIFPLLQESLFNLVSEQKLHNRPFPLPERRAIQQQLLETLRSLHARHIIHRDIKPDNMMRTKDHQWVLIDFGFAILPQTAVSSLAGSPLYLPPEIAETCLDPEDPSEERLARILTPKLDLFPLDLVFLLLYEGPDGPLFQQFDFSKQECGFAHRAHLPENVLKAIREMATSQNPEKRLIGRMLDPNPATRISAQEAFARL